MLGFTDAFKAEGTGWSAAEHSGSGYTVRFNGVLLGTADSEALPYYGSLLVGAERDYDLEPFRQSALTVWSLKVE